MHNHHDQYRGSVVVFGAVRERKSEKETMALSARNGYNRGIDMCTGKEAAMASDFENDNRKAEGAHSAEDPWAAVRQVIGMFPEDFLTDRNQPIVLAEPKREDFWRSSCPVCVLCVRTSSRRSFFCAFVFCSLLSAAFADRFPKGFEHFPDRLP